MTYREFAVLLNALKYEAVILFKIVAPKDTWHLAESIKVEPFGNMSFRLVIDSFDVPYVEYTEEVWTDRYGWKRKNYRMKKGNLRWDIDKSVPKVLLTNPNQGWIAAFVDYLAEYISIHLKARLRRV